MSGLDSIFLALYFMLVFGIGWWSSRRSLKDSRSYFLAGGSIGWMAIGASLFASNISAEHFIGLAGSGASSGLAVGQFEWLACFILLLLGWVFAPIYLRTAVFTMPEFLERRYNSHCRTYLSAVSLLAYVFTKISVAIYAGALVLETIVGLNIWAGAVILIVATGVYTVFGGLRAVIYTDFFQAFILIGGGVLLTVIAISDLGGLSVLVERTPPEFFSVWKSFDNPEFPWTGILLGAPILGVWYWCTDQMIVQRTLAANDVATAQRATILAGFLKILPVFILVLPGIAGMLLFPDVAPNRMYATMVNELLPPGIKGLVVAALLAALMSSLSSVFNSSSTLVVMDFYKKWRPQAGERQLVFAGQVATVLLVAVGLLWLPFIGVMSDQLYIYLQSVQAYISPPIAAVFLLGIFVRGVNAAGALATLLFGFVLGAARFICEILLREQMLTPPPLVWFASINFLHFAVVLFAVSVLVHLGVSRLFAQAPADTTLLYSRKEDQPTAGNRANVLLSALLVAVIAGLWVFFSPLFWR